MTRRAERAAVLAGAVIFLAGCGGGDRRAARATPRATEAPRAEAGHATPTPVATPPPRLRATGRCPEAAFARCFTLKVPLDRSGGTKATTTLRVAAAGPRRGPVVVLLSGGPGEPGIPFLQRLRTVLGPRADSLRLVTLDQRGTGRNALRCPALQRAMGASDLTPPPAAAVTDCARRIGGGRRFYATADTVADLEALRVALRAKQLALDGVSYGTYVAERYAVAHPDRVRALVLDSVVPHDGLSVLSTTPLKATERVLRIACEPCHTDPVADLKSVVERRHNGPEMLDMITTLSIFRPHLKSGIAALRAAREGDDGPLDRLAAGVRRIVGAYTAPQLSQGLHASTLCADTPTPWGGPAKPLKGRRPALDRAVNALSLEDLGPYDRETAGGNGIALTCLNWPPTPLPSPPTGGRLPDVPTLLVAGQQDLSTPLEWARHEATLARGAKVLVVPGAGHSVQSQGIPRVLRAVRRTLG